MDREKNMNAKTYDDWDFPVFDLAGSVTGFTVTESLTAESISSLGGGRGAERAPLRSWLVLEALSRKGSEDWRRWEAAIWTWQG